MPSRSLYDLVPEAHIAFMKALKDEVLGTKSFRVICVLRSFEEQYALWNQGRKKLEIVNGFRVAAGMDPITEAENQHTVTDTKHSKHLPDENGKSHAVDIICLDENRKWTWEEKYYDVVGPLFEKYGFKWGVMKLEKNGVLQRWDKGHLEWNHEPTGA
jgi:uncharacterized protein YbdZ (MbtH family)